MESSTVKIKNYDIFGTRGVNSMSYKKVLEASETSGLHRTRYNNVTCVSVSYAVILLIMLTFTVLNMCKVQHVQNELLVLESIVRRLNITQPDSSSSNVRTTLTPSLDAASHVAVANISQYFESSTPTQATVNVSDSISAVLNLTALSADPNDVDETSGRYRRQAPEVVSNEQAAHGDRMRSSVPPPHSRHRNQDRGVVHFEVDGSTYGLTIQNEGDVIKSWSERRESRRNRSTFGTYQQESGKYKISKNGLYMIYSQVTYYDNSGRWCHAIKRGQNILAKCLASEWGIMIDKNTNRYVPTVHNCFTSTVTFLRRNEEVSIISLYGSRVIHQGPEMSFWGIVRLG